MAATCLIRPSHALADSFQDASLILTIQESCELIQQQHLQCAEH